MAPLMEISRIFFTTYLLAMVMPIFWIVLFLVYMQYRRQAGTEEKLFGRVINPIGRQMLLSLALGALGGLFASIVLIVLGLSLEQIGLYFIWPVALLLLLVNPRYLCFAYAGGIVAVGALAVRHILIPLFPALEANLIFSSLMRIHIPALLVLIALLHLIEALLIYIGGHWGCSPIYLKKEGGEVVGAFTLQRFWPIPLVALLVSIVLQTDVAGVSMPDWWPILQPTLEPGQGQGLQYMIIPVAAGLGYADMAFSSTPRERALFSAKHLGLYSIVLLVIAVGSEFYPWLVIPGVLFAPLGHELLILMGKKKEQHSRPRYQHPLQGVRLMRVLPGTVAAEAGLQEEDLVLGINGVLPADNADLLQKIDESYFMALIEGVRAGERFSTVLKKRPHSEEQDTRSFRARLRPRAAGSVLHRCAALGLIPVPPPDSQVYLEIRKNEPLNKFKRLKSKLQGWRKKTR